MTLHEALTRVEKSARIFQGGGIVVKENYVAGLEELAELMSAVEDAKSQGASGYDIAEATAGRVRTIDGEG